MSELLRGIQTPSQFRKMMPWVGLFSRRIMHLANKFNEIFFPVSFIRSFFLWFRRVGFRGGGKRVSGVWFPFIIAATAILSFWFIGRSWGLYHESLVEEFYQFDPYGLYNHSTAFCISWFKYLYIYIYTPYKSHQILKSEKDEVGFAAASSSTSSCGPTPA
jgi:hypothetical protein